MIVYHLCGVKSEDEQRGAGAGQAHAPEPLTLIEHAFSLFTCLSEQFND